MNHRARKRFGQNFLVDGNVIDRIVASIAPRPGERIVEIGPGREAITGPLIDAGADLADAVRLLVDLDVVTGFQQVQRRRRAANAAANDGDFEFVARSLAGHLSSGLTEAASMAQNDAPGKCSAGNRNPYL